MNIDCFFYIGHSLFDNLPEVGYLLDIRNIQYSNLILRYWQNCIGYILHFAWMLCIFEIRYPLTCIFYMLDKKILNQSLYVTQKDTKPKRSIWMWISTVFFILDIRYLTFAMKLATYWIFACWANIVDDGPTLAQHRINIGPTYFAGWVCTVSIRLWERLCVESSQNKAV